MLHSFAIHIYFTDLKERPLEHLLIGFENQISDNRWSRLTFSDWNSVVKNMHEIFIYTNIYNWNWETFYCEEFKIYMEKAEKYAFKFYGL